MKIIRWVGEMVVDLAAAILLLIAVVAMANAFFNRDEGRQSSGGFTPLSIMGIGIGRRE